jgi:CxxC-x17-CxxC domain-containing protein
MEFYKSKYSDGKTDGRNSRRENDVSRSFRNSGDTRGSRNDSRDESTTVTCSDCGTECTVPFVPRTNKPVYCSDCFRQNKPQDSGNDRYSRDDRGSRYSRDDRGSRYSRDDRGSRDNDREDTEVTCADCGNQCTVPFVPRSNKPVYCSDCFRQHKPDDSRDDRRSGNDRYSRDDRGSRSSYGRESSRGDNRSRKPRNDKFLRKQESFYSNGSDKFYETVKEKLYEILGGKICSSCGFKDDRALGISPISDNVSSDSTGRGGDAASWGKYISSPDLAKSELGVFCLNCNQIREPVSKSKQEKSGSKKSKYFPR